jgi:YD repeat-containing protein
VLRAGLLAFLAMLMLPALAQAAPPVACFTVSPSSPQTNETTTLNSSCSTDDKEIKSRAWDLDNDGQFDDGTATSVTKTWATSGTYTVRLRVTDDRDAVIASKTVTVRNRAPAASFTVSPASAPTGSNFTFTTTSTDPDGTIAAYAWDTDGDTTVDFNDGTGPTATKSFPAAGSYTIRLRVTDNNGAQTITTRTATATNRAPTASFTINPATVATGEVVTFTSTSTDPDGSITSYEWDTDGDAIADYDGDKRAQAARPFATPGTYPIRLRVTDNNGAVSTASKTVTITNRPPTAAFTVSPADPLPGQTITFTSTSTDPDGTIASYAWDTDGDATVDFNDGTGSAATKSFPAAGSYTIRLRVTDNNGGQAIATTTITVGEPESEPLPEPRSDTGQQTFDISTPVAPPPADTPPSAPVAPLRFLDPFPVVRLRGRTTRKGARLTAFTVRAPHGSLVQVRCKGPGCPAKRLREKVKTKSGRGSATVHFRRLERFLRAGTELQVSVTQEGMVGKYTHIKIRSVAVPVRSDRCLLPGSSKPRACPSL